jgi:hypothetical protein
MPRSSKKFYSSLPCVVRVAGGGDDVAGGVTSGVMAGVAVPAGMQTAYLKSTSLNPVLNV